MKTLFSLLSISLLLSSCHKKNNCTSQQTAYDIAKVKYDSFSAEAKAKGVDSLPTTISPYYTGYDYDQGFVWCVFVTGAENGQPTYQDSINTYPFNTVSNKSENLRLNFEESSNNLNSCNK